MQRLTNLLSFLDDECTFKAISIASYFVDLVNETAETKIYKYIDNVVIGNALNLSGNI